MRIVSSVLFSEGVFMEKQGGVHVQRLFDRAFTLTRLWDRLQDSRAFRDNGFCGLS